MTALEQKAQGGARFTPRAWQARRAPGNVEAAATLYYADDEPLGGCPVADVYDAFAVPLIAAAPGMYGLLALAAEDPSALGLVPDSPWLEAVRAELAKAEGRS